MLRTRVPFSWLSRLRARRVQRAADRLAWERVVVPDADGLTPFQHEAEGSIGRTLAAHGHSLENREVNRGDSEAFITSTFKGGEAKVWIYLDGTEIQAPNRELRLERWDTDTPEAHHTRVAAFLEKMFEAEEGAA